MGVVDELVQARVDYERGEWAAALDTWSGVQPDALGVEDLRSAALSAYLLGRVEDAVGYHQRAFRLCEEAGDRAGAARCAFHLAMMLATSGEEALAGGWTARAERLLDEVDGDVVERGYVAFLHMFRHIGAGDWPAAAECADRTVAAGRRYADADLLALGLCASGRITIYSGHVPEGLVAAGRGDGRGDRRRGLAGGVRQRLLHRDRGLPGDRRLRAGWPSGPRRCTAGARRCRGWSPSPGSARCTAGR